MIYLLFAAVSVAVYFCVRYFLLKQALGGAAGELQAITRDLEQNRIVRLQNPQKEMEALLYEINQNLTEIRQIRLGYDKKEQELLKQIENISHDLRTPLTSILGFLSLIDKGNMNEENQETLIVVRKKAETLKKLIEQFYALSRLSADDYHLEQKETDISRILRETVIDSYQELEQKQLEVQVDVPDVPVYVYGDGDALERIFLNLLQNAERYGVTCLRIHLTYTADQVLVSMENDTEQLEQTDVDTLFERFYTGDSSRNREGTGLGLPIAKYLAKNMNGDMKAILSEQNEKKWIRLELSLPRLKV